MENIKFQNPNKNREKNQKILLAMMDLRAFQLPIAMIFHVESELAVENAGFLRPAPENSGNNPDLFRKISGKIPENFRKKVQKCSGNVPELFRNISGFFLENFR